MQEGHEVASGFLVAGCDAAALFQAGEQAFDFVAFAVDLAVVIPRGLAVRSRRDDRLRSRLLDDCHQWVAVVPFVHQNVLGVDPFDHRFGLRHVVGLARRQQELHRVSEAVARRMNLAAEASDRAAELLVCAAFFEAPAAWR